MSVRLFSEGDYRRWLQGILVCMISGSERQSRKKTPCPRSTTRGLLLPPRPLFRRLGPLLARGRSPSGSVVAHRCQVGFAFVCQRLCRMTNTGLSPKASSHPKTPCLAEGCTKPRVCPKCKNKKNRGNVSALECSTLQGQRGWLPWLRKDDLAESHPGVDPVTCQGSTTTKRQLIQSPVT